jgi:hypothetical protein
VQLFLVEYILLFVLIVILRRVRVDGEQAMLRLEATNSAYDDFNIPPEQVLEIYRVVGNLKQY